VPFWEPRAKTVYIIDATGSMISAYDAVRAAMAKNVFDHPAPGQATDIIVVSEKLQVLSPILVEEKEAFLKSAAQFVDSIEPAGPGEERMGQAFRLAIAMKPDAIVFLTDDDIHDDEYSGVKQAMAGVSIPVYVGVFSEHDNGPYRDLAKATNGDYRRFSPDPPKR
jgi:hypothetical protein